MRKGLAAALAGVIAMGLATGAKAESWYGLGMGDKGIAAIDRDSIRWRDGKPSADLVMVYAALQPVDNTLFQGGIMNVTFDCHNITFLATSVRYYDGDWLPVQSIVPPAEDFSPIPANATVSNALGIICHSEVKPNVPIFPDVNSIRLSFFSYLARHSKDGNK